MRMFVTLVLGSLLSFPACAQVLNPLVPNAPRPTQGRFSRGISSSPAPADPPRSAATSPEPPAGDISLYTVVDLALRHSNKVRAAEAGLRVARGAWKETRDAYVPSFAVGSGLGYSYGFPLGTPTLFNVTSQSLLFSFSQHDYIRSTRAAQKAAALTVKNIRQQVILDATLDYVDLTKTLDQIAALNQATADTNKLLAIMRSRLQAGLETDMQMTRARLTRAQIDLHRIQMENHADELRQHLSNLTGIDAAMIQPEVSSVPPLPNLNFPSLLESSPQPPSVLAADATADSKLFAAWGDKRQNRRPTVQFAAQYALFSTFNNYQEYYGNHFQYNNIGIGIQAVWPLFDRTRGDKAAESEAEAIRARRQAELARIQNSEGNLALWHSLRELEAQENVAALQQHLSRDTLAMTVTEMNRGGASGPVSPQQAEQQRINERTSYVALQDAQFHVTKIKLDLLNAIGGLEDWAKQGAQMGTDNPSARRVKGEGTPHEPDLKMTPFR